MNAKLIVLTLLLALPVYAQTYPTQSGQYPNPSSRDRFESRGQELQELNLNPQQRSELQGIRSQERTLHSQLQAARASGNVQQEQALRSQINGLHQQGLGYLNPTQRSQLQSYRSHGRRRGGGF